MYYTYVLQGEVDHQFYVGYSKMPFEEKNLKRDRQIIDITILLW